MLSWCNPQKAKPNQSPLRCGYRENLEWKISKGKSIQSTSIWESLPKANFTIVCVAYCWLFHMDSFSMIFKMRFFLKKSLSLIGTLHVKCLSWLNFYNYNFVIRFFMMKSFTQAAPWGIHTIQNNLELVLSAIIEIETIQWVVEINNEKQT